MLKFAFEYLVEINSISICPFPGQTVYSDFHMFAALYSVS